MTAARQFLAEDSFYDAAGRDDGSSETRAIRGAEASLAEIRPALVTLFEDEVKALIILLGDLRSSSSDLAQIDAIARSADRIIDVAETLGYPSVSRAACKLRNTCTRIDGDAVEAPFVTHRTALQTCLDAHHRDQR